MTAPMLLVVLLAIIGPLILYVREGWRDRTAVSDETRDQASASPETDEVEFFAAGRRLTVRQYATTTVAYGLQMAAIVLFAQWGYYYGYSTFVVPFAWCVGFFLLGLSAKRLDRFLQSSRTLHGFLGERHGGSNSLVRLAAIATLLGLGGALFAELGYATTLVKHILDRDESFRYLLMAFFLATVLLYVLPGGFRAVVDTDSRQLPFAYVGLAVFLSAVIYATERVGASSTPTTVIGLLAFAAIALLSLIGVFTAASPARSGRMPSLLVPLTCLTILGIAYFLGTREQSGPSTAVHRSPWRPQPMGLLTASSLVVANAMWQFVDLSTFQRLTALHLPRNAQDRTRLLRKAVFWTALESPLSWCIGIAIGIGLGQLGMFGGPDGAWVAYDRFLSSLAEGNGVGALFPEAVRAAVIGLSLAGLIAIMLSSVDSLGSAMAFTTSADLVHPASRSAANTTARARLITVVVLLAVWGLLAVWEAHLSSDFTLSAWLYTAYAMQLALVGVCICALLDVRLGPKLAFLSVAAGVIASVACGTLLVVTADPNVFVIPPLVAVSVSLAVVFVPLVRRLCRGKAGGAM